MSTVIQLAASADVETINAEMPSQLKFCTDADVTAWLKGINENPSSPQAHLKPKDRDLTRDELESMFSVYTTIGRLDVYEWDGCGEQLAQMVVALEKYQDQISYIETPDHVANALADEGLELLSNRFLAISKPKILHELPPAERQEHERREKLNGGLFLTSAFGNNTARSEFWLIFGSVDSPRFLKDDKYLDDDLNDLYRDANGRAYMLLPLLPFGKSISETVEVWYHKACELGFRESFLTFATGIYNLEITDSAVEHMDLGEVSLRTAKQLYWLAVSKLNYNSRFVQEKKGVRYIGSKMSNNLRLAIRILKEKFGIDTANELNDLKLNTHPL